MDSEVTVAITTGTISQTVELKTQLKHNLKPINQQSKYL